MIQNKIQGCLLGGAIGDALGYQIEFNRGIREKQVTQFKNNFGIISDDTQMTLFTATSLLTYQMQQNKSNEVDTVYLGYLDWFDTQNGTNRGRSISWIKNIKELHAWQAPGNTCLYALNSGKMGTINKPLNNSKGCGGVMRIAPCGIWANTPTSAGRLAADCAAITHGHKLSHISSFVCASIIHMLIYENKTIKRAILDSLKLINSYHDNFKENKKPYEPDSMLTFFNLMSLVVELNNKNISDIDAIRQLGEGWVADEALAIALYACLKYPNNFKDAIVCAVNHDGDSDSTGAIAGNIMGASLGMANIPQYYVDNIQLKDVILQVADDLYVAKEM